MRRFCAAPMIMIKTKRLNPDFSSVTADGRDAVEKVKYPLGGKGVALCKRADIA